MGIIMSISCKCIYKNLWVDYCPFYQNNTTFSLFSQPTLTIDSHPPLFFFSLSPSLKNQCCAHLSQTEGIPPGSGLLSTLSVSWDIIDGLSVSERGLLLILFHDVQPPLHASDHKCIYLLVCSSSPCHRKMYRHLHRIRSCLV